MTQNTTDSSLKDMGLNREGARLGSRFVPAVVLAIFVLWFVANGITPPAAAENEVVKESSPSAAATQSSAADSVKEATAVTSDSVNIQVESETQPQINTPDAIEPGTGSAPPMAAAGGGTATQSSDEISRTSTTDEPWYIQLLRFLLLMISLLSKTWAAVVPLLIKSQLKTIIVIAMYSLVPGLFGLSYRRAFGPWFLAAFAVMFGTNWLFDMVNMGSVAPIVDSRVTINVKGEAPIEVHAKDWGPALFTVEVNAFVLLLFFRLRLQSVGALGKAARRRAMLLAGFCALLAVLISYRCIETMDFWPWMLVAVSLAVFAIGLTWQYWSKRTSTHSKNIVVCLDGTWNLPGTTDFGFLAETNVYKLFKLLKGEPGADKGNANQCKEYRDANGEPKQVGFYYHGVGNPVENSELGQLLGGAFGMGAAAIVERAYLDIVRVYRPGDRIFLHGFSRGAAIARLVANTIASRGIPKTMWTLRIFGRHWPVWTLAEKVVADDVHGTDIPIAVLGVWDTVGAFGVSKNILGIPFQKINLLKNLDVPLNVQRAYHMVALDETRDSFEPTLMDPDPITVERIVEVWFSGNHSNVGGGYANDALSNVAFDFLLSRISSGYACDGKSKPGEDESWGLYLNAGRKGHCLVNEETKTTLINPDPRGGLRHATGAMYSHLARTLPLHAVISDTVFERMRDALPVYAPESVLKLNQELLRIQKQVLEGAKSLQDTKSITSEECDAMQGWGRERLTLMKWSQYLELELDDKSPSDDKTRLKDKLCPKETLSNSTLHKARNEA